MPVVLLSSMQATSSFQGSLYRTSSIRKNGEAGGSHNAIRMFLWTELLLPEGLCMGDSGSPAGLDFACLPLFFCVNALQVGTG